MFRHEIASRTQFVLLDQCGCPIDVREGETLPGALSAMSAFADGNRARVLRWQQRGRAVVHVTHAEYERRFAPMVEAGCPHRRVPAPRSHRRRVDLS